MKKLAHLTLTLVLAFAFVPVAATQALAATSIADAQVTGISAEGYTYTGNPITPKPTVALGGKTLVEGVDYELSYNYNVEANSKSTVNIKGIGNYSGRTWRSFTINRAPITSATLSETSYTYDGTEKKPQITVTGNGKTLVRDVDYDVHFSDACIGAGKKTVTVVGKNNYTGAEILQYTINKAPITSIELSQTRYAHDGEEKFPSVTVKLANGTVLSNEHYVVKYGSKVGTSLATIGTKTVDVEAKGNYEGTLSTTYEIVDPSAFVPDDPSDPSKPSVPGGSTTPNDKVVMYRLYNPNSGEHFYTAKVEERDSLQNVGWSYEGEAWTAPTISATPVYRLYSGTDHHYCMDAVERDALVEAGWSYEGIGWYSDDAQGVPLYRQFNPNVDPSAPFNNSGSHNYTTDVNEHWSLVGIGWADEGVGWYGMK